VAAFGFPIEHGNNPFKSGAVSVRNCHEAARALRGGDSVTGLGKKPAGVAQLAGDIGSVHAECRAERSQYAADSFQPLASPMDAYRRRSGIVQVGASRRQIGDHETDKGKADILVLADPVRHSSLPLSPAHLQV